MATITISEMLNSTNNNTNNTNIDNTNIYGCYRDFQIEMPNYSNNVNHFESISNNKLKRILKKYSYDFLEYIYERYYLSERVIFFLLKSLIFKSERLEWNACDMMETCYEHDNFIGGDSWGKEASYYIKKQQEYKKILEQLK